MNLYFYKNEYPNFGDDINPWFWARALNCKLDQLEDVGYLIGIGTILNDFLPQNTQLHILGSGVGYGNISPRLQRNWNVHFVRGPLTAAAIGLGRKKAVTDPVILLNKWVDLNFTKNTNFSFVPHFKIDSQKLKKACLKSGLSYVSPRLNREEFIQKIGE